MANYRFLDDLDITPILGKPLKLWDVNGSLVALLPGEELVVLATPLKRRAKVAADLNGSEPGGEEASPAQQAAFALDV